MSLRLDLPSCGYTRPNIREKWPRPSSRGPKTTIYKTNLWNPLQVTKNLEWRLENYRTGFIGEGECLLMLLPEIPKNWLVLADLNFPLVAGRMQIDIMLISSRKDFHFEVKNLLQN